MTPRIISIFLAILSSGVTLSAEQSVQGVETAGHYVGVARVTKVSTPDELLVTTTYRVAAHVRPDGSIAIMNAVADAPAAAANVESSITRLTRNARGFYYADGVAYANVQQRGKNGLRITYQNPPNTIQSSVPAGRETTGSSLLTSVPQIPPNPMPSPSPHITIIVPEKYAKFEFTLTRK